jgi:hypothetical protein
MATENCKKRSFIIFNLTKRYYRDYIKEDEVSRTCSIHIWRTREIDTGLWYGVPKERNHAENLALGGKLH